MRCWLNSFILYCALSPALLAAVRYDGDGAPGNSHEEMRWLINRARYAPEMEADRLGLINSSNRNYDCCEDITGLAKFGTNEVQWAPWAASKPPLAFNTNLITAAWKHVTDLQANSWNSIQFPDRDMHRSPSNSLYYLPGTRVWDRYTNELYHYKKPGWGGENIVWGSGSVGAKHNGLFIDTWDDSRNHRKNILLWHTYAAREIGVGSSGANYGFVITFSGSGTVHFVTDTIFYDANSNGVYNAGEGIGNIEIRLFNGNTELSWYDVSSTSGSFAIPVSTSDVPAGSSIAVKLANKSGTNRTLTIPIGYYSRGDFTISNNQTRLLGTFTQPAGYTNIGFRNIDLATHVQPVNITNGIKYFSFETLPKSFNRVERSTNLTSWTTLNSMTASVSTIAVTDTNKTLDKAFYRNVIIRDP